MMNPVTTYAAASPLRVQTYRGGVETVLEIEDTFEPSTDDERLLAADLAAAGLLVAAEAKRGKTAKVEPVPSEES